MQLIADQVRQIVGTPAQKELAENSLAWFCALYLPHYLTFTSPDFHYEMCRDLENDDERLIEIIAFRESAKSTIVSLAYILWSALYKKRRFIIICSDTGTQAKQIIANMIYELEFNKQIINDFGTMQGREEWQATNVFLINEVRIMSRSRSQKMRGLRHLQHRPDLIVLDDVENIDAVRTKDQRDKTEEWFLSDVKPCRDAVRGKIVIIGNLLHNDSFIQRMKNNIQKTGMGIVREYPLLDKGGVCIWPEKHPPEVIKELKNNKYFRREYLLDTLIKDDAIIKKIPYYSKLPKLDHIAIGVDLAISQKETADYSAINVAGEDEDRKIFNMENIYGRWNFNETLDKIWNTYQAILKMHPSVPLMLGIEDVAYQRAAIEEFKRRYGIQPTPVKQTKDKKARLEVMVPYFENDQIAFQHEGMEDLIIQLLNFGVERHDDCVDSAEISWRLLINAERPQIQWL